MAKMKKSVTGTSPIWQVCTYAVLLLVVLVAVQTSMAVLSMAVLAVVVQAAECSKKLLLKTK